MKKTALLFYILLHICLPVICRAADSAKRPKQLVANGAWSWFQDERAVVVGHKVFFASVASPSGNIDVHQWNLSTGKVKDITLFPGFQSDDHDAPALLVLPDKRLLAAWQGHESRGLAAPAVRERWLHWARTEKPADISRWSEIKTMDVGAACSYSNLMQLSEENGHIYNFHRGRWWNPNYLVSADDGKTFEYAGRLLKWGHLDKPDVLKVGQDGGRPYLKYVSDGKKTIHFISSEDHPRAYRNSIYYGFIQDGGLYRNSTEQKAAFHLGDSPAPSPQYFTRLFRGNVRESAWPIDLHLDAQGQPVALFSVHKKIPEAIPFDASYRGGDIHYYYARVNNGRWLVNEAAFGGHWLYAKESFYSGLGAISPQNVDEIYISTDVHPVSGQPLVSAADKQTHFEIFRGRTNDYGSSWQWSAVTENSTADNIRPVVPVDRGSSRNVLLWLKGQYSSFKDYKLAIVGALLPLAASDESAH